MPLTGEAGCLVTRKNTLEDTPILMCATVLLSSLKCCVSACSGVSKSSELWQAYAQNHIMSPIVAIWYLDWHWMNSSFSNKITFSNSCLHSYQIVFQWLYCLLFSLIGCPNGYIWVHHVSSYGTWLKTNLHWDNDLVLPRHILYIEWPHRSLGIAYMSEPHCLVIINFIFLSFIHSLSWVMAPPFASPVAFTDEYTATRNDPLRMRSNSSPMKPNSLQSTVATGLQLANMLVCAEKEKQNAGSKISAVASAISSTGNWESTLEKSIKSIVSIKASHTRAFDTDTAG